MLFLFVHKCAGGYIHVCTSGFISHSPASAQKMCGRIFLTWMQGEVDKPLAADKI